MGRVSEELAAPVSDAVIGYDVTLPKMLVPRVGPFRRGAISIEGTFAVEFFPGAAERLWEMLRPKCGALLFPLPSPVQVVAATGSATFLMDFSGGAPVQGPQPAACALDKDHRIGWHWYDGTWWKA